MVPRNAETGSGMPQGTNSRNPSGHCLKVRTHSSPMPEENQPRRAAFLGSEPQLLLLPSLSYQRREWRLEGMCDPPKEQQCMAGTQVAPSAPMSLELDSVSMAPSLS